MMYPKDAMGELNDAVLAVERARSCCSHDDEANDGLCACVNEHFQQRRRFKVRHPNLVTYFDRICQT